MVALLAASTGCKVNPVSPFEQDAIVTWHNIFRQSELKNRVIQLVDLKKTDGQFAEVNGVKVYTLYYEARDKHLTKTGHWNPGNIETIRSNYGFQKTEKGWQVLMERISSTKLCLTKIDPHPALPPS